MNPLTAVLLTAAAAALHGSPPAPPQPPHSPRAEAVWPIGPPRGAGPEIVTRFDPPGVRWSAGHRGADLLGTAGDPVHAALPGTVTFAGTLAGRGVVVVDHGATRTTYEPVDASVTRGTRVEAGAVIGALQAGRSHCPPRACLHLGLIAGREYLDPLSLFGAGGVRLLPTG